MKRINLEQGTAPWFRWRDEGVGGSEVGPIFLGRAWPFKDSHADKVFERKLTGARSESSYVMRRGRWLEEDVRLDYQNRMGHDAPPVCCEHDYLSWMHASLDGLTDEGVIVEIKVPNWQSHSTALAGFAPDYYMPQLQWQLAVTGLDRLHYVSHSINQRFGENDKMAIVEVLPDLDMQRKLVEVCLEWWQRLEQARSQRLAG